MADNPDDSSPPTPNTRLSVFAGAGTQESSPFGNQGTNSPFQNLDPQAKRDNDLKRRRISESRRQRTPMSCDRCKIRKIKCINPNPGPCDYCSRMKFHCQITAQRKHRPLYFTSDEQFQWMIAILQHFVPDINFELESLKAVGKSLGIQKPSTQVITQSPMRALPQTLEAQYKKDTLTPNPSERLSERSHTPQSENGKDDETNAVEGLLTMEPSSQQATPAEPQETNAVIARAPSSSPKSQLPPHPTSRLPPRVVADSYIERFFTDVNDTFCILSYKDFMQWYILLYPDKPLDHAKQVILHVIFAFATKDAADGACDLYFSQALRIIGLAVENGKGNLETLQALILLSLYSLHGLDSIGAWTFAGAAVRVALHMNLHRDNEFIQRQDRETYRRVWWTLYDLERFLSSSFALPSAINDDLVNIALPPDHNRWGESLSTPNSGYAPASASLSQIIGRISSYLLHPNLTLPTLCHYLSELQQWSDNLPETLRRFHIASQGHSRIVNFLSLRWFDAVMISTRPFLSSLVRYGANALPKKFSAFFQFAANAASIAARETLVLMKHLESQRMFRGQMPFERHVLLQSAEVLASSCVVSLGKRDERLRFRESIEMLRRMPGVKQEGLIQDMRNMEKKFEKLGSAKAPRSPDAPNIFDSPGIPSLSAKGLLQQFVPPSEQNGNEVGTEEEVLLSRWIPRQREDVLECVTVRLKREGVIE